MTQWAIVNKDGESRWSKEEGWVSGSSYDTFTEADKTTVTLSSDGEWRELREFTVKEPQARWINNYYRVQALDEEDAVETYYDGGHEHIAESIGDRIEWVDPCEGAEAFEPEQIAGEIALAQPTLTVDQLVDAAKLLPEDELWQLAWNLMNEAKVVVVLALDLANIRDGLEAWPEDDDPNLAKATDEQIFQAMQTVAENYDISNEATEIRNQVEEEIDRLMREAA
jgi:outer membrane protein assembly factor BamB